MVLLKLKGVVLNTGLESDKIEIQAPEALICNVYNVTNQVVSQLVIKLVIDSSPQVASVNLLGSTPGKLIAGEQPAIRRLAACRGTWLRPPATLSPSPGCPALSTTRPRWSLFSHLRPMGTVRSLESLMPCKDQRCSTSWLVWLGPCQTSIRSTTCAQY